MSDLRLMWRKSLNIVMLTLTGVAAFAVVSVLFLILGYLIWNGGKSLNWDFFTQLPKPVGETGGGMANAIVGSLKLLFLAAVMGLPIGLMAGVYLAEFGGKTFSFVIRYTTDLLNGVPSIVMGIFAYSLVVLPVKHFSALAGGVALGVMVIPITVRSTEEFLRAVPGQHARGRHGAGRQQVADDRDRDSARGERGHSHRNVAFAGARGRRNGAAALYRIQQPLLEPRMEPADCFASRDDLYVCDRALRRLASPGMGCWIGAAWLGTDCKSGLPAGVESPGVLPECLIWLQPRKGKNSLRRLAPKVRASELSFNGDPKRRVRCALRFRISISSMAPSRPSSA